MDDPRQSLDTTIDIVTPENISFRYRVAGPFRRLPAFAIDLLLRFAVWAALIFLFGILGVFRLIDGALGVAVMFLLLFFMEWLYGGLLEAFWNGQTVGKRVMGIRVLSADGQPITGLQAMLRNILRFADMMPLIPWAAFSDAPSAVAIPTFMVGLVTPLSNRRFQRLGDIVCGTMVVVEEKTRFWETVRFEDPRVPQLAAELPSQVTIPRTMARTLATYVNRRHLFSAPRRREIARHLGEPLVQRFGLLPDTSYDLLLCALYHRTFAAKQDADAPLARPYLESQSRAVEVKNLGPAVSPVVAVAAPSPSPLPPGPASEMHESI